MKASFFHSAVHMTGPNSLVILKALHWMFIFPYKQSSIEMWCEELLQCVRSSIKESIHGFSLENSRSEQCIVILQMGVTLNGRSLVR